ncbi:RND transporter [Saccharopolyspora sp. NPDC049426]|uniref:RND transporter n=1 Tax=Saccharopolyspora sp. NPDC049426 TaxID=3155652 RepID=UPI0034371497
MQLRVETGVTSLLPASDKSVQQYEEVASSFGGDPVVVLVESKEPGRLLGAEQLPRLLRMEGQLAALPDAAVAYGPATTLNQIAGQTQNMLAEISGRRDGLRAAAESEAANRGATPQAASAAGEQAVAGFDQRYGALLVRGLPAGLPTLHNPSFVHAVAFNHAGQPKPQWRFVIPSRNSVAVLVRPRQGLDAAGTQRLVDGVRKTVGSAGLGAERVSVSGVPVVADELGKSVAREAPILGVAGLLAVGVCLFAVPWTRRRWRVVPLLVTVVASVATLAVFGLLARPISLGVMVFLPVLLGIGSDFPTYLAQRASKRSVLAVGAATAAGFGTVVASPLPFVRDLGLALCIGVLLSVLFGFLASLRRPSAHRESDTQGDSPAQGPAVHMDEGTTKPRLAKVAVAFMLAMPAVAGWIALPSLKVEASPERLISGLPAVAEADHVERVMGSSGEMDVVLRGDDVRSPQALAWMRAAQDSVVAHHGDRIRPVLSAPDLLRFLGDAPTSEQVNAAMRLLPPYLTGAVVRDDARVGLVSFGVRMEDMQDLRDLRDRVRTLLPPPPPGYQAEVTGLPVVAVRGYELLSEGRYASNVLGIAATGAVLALALRRRGDAVRAVVAALLATGTGLLVLWLTAVPLTPLTVALGSLTAAVGCEFTVFLAEASRTADMTLRRSVVLAAAASAVGYAVLVFSSVSVIQQFGLLLTCSVGLSLISALCVTQHSWLGRGEAEKQAAPPADERIHAEGMTYD